MNTQELLKSPHLAGLTLTRTKLEQVAAIEVFPAPKAILPSVKLQAPPAARIQQVARPTRWSLCYQPETGEEIVFAVLGFAAFLLILIVFL